MRSESPVLEPQSTVLFVLLVVVFAGLMTLALLARWIPLRVLCAVLVFLPAMTFGVLAVNRYYGYYQTWGAAVADFSNQPAAQATSGARLQLAAIDDSPADLGMARRMGDVLRLTLAGQRSHISRMVYVYLPPEYFQSSYSRYRFPVIELIHGSPGEPQDWINVVGVTRMLVRLDAARMARPAVLVMPDANGARNIDLQCLNQVGGPQDMTYLAVDLPDQLPGLVRVQPPGSAWGIAGYSSGGYCAANIALHYRQRYGYAGVLSGYYEPGDNQLVDPVRYVNPFGHSRALAQENNPIDEIEAMRRGTIIPQFWLGAGEDNKGDVQAAQVMLQGLRLLRPGVTLTLTRGAGHNMVTWRAEVPAMLGWMTDGLAQAAARDSRATAGTAAAPAGMRRVKTKR
jgi:enterochelin esterase-like enzyme